MSFRQKVIVRVSIFVVLLALFLFGAVISPPGASQRRSETPLFPGLKPALVRKIEIADSSSSLALSRAGGWIIEGSGASYPASQLKVEGLLKEVAALTRGTLVTKSSKAADGLGLSEKEAKRLVLSGAKGEKLCELSVGRAGVAGRGYYLRSGSAAEVFQSGEGLSSYLSTERRTWADLRILPSDIKAEAVMRLSIASSLAPRIDYTLLKEKSAAGAMTWSLGAGAGPVDQQTVDSLVRAVLALEGGDFLADQDPARASLASPAAEVTISLADNRTFVLQIGDTTTGDQNPCALGGGSLGYLVPRWRLDGILKPKESLAVSPG
ncbi:MAG: DUF4340 domain-containing protein [Spirochaetes bacterium]|nr:DUF4340 domain-containing protein [Spirochaetota bacterium]